MVSAQLIEEPELIERLRTGQRRSRAAVGRKAGSSVLRTRKLHKKGAVMRKIFWHCRLLRAEIELQRECALVNHHKNERIIC